MSRLAPIALIALVAPFVPQAGQASDEPAFGYWLTENRKAIVQTRTCGEKLCGHMVWMANPLDETGEAKLGADGAPLCGVKLIGGLDAESAGKWNGGWILDPRSGDRYSAEVAVVSENAIEVRGYLGLRFLGSSQTWTRVEDDRGGC